MNDDLSGPPRRPPARLIPVLDLRGGVVVRAVRGERERYAPVRSTLVDSAEPIAVARALLQAAGDARRLYIADLDAILDGRPHRALLPRLQAALPGIELWLDAGFNGLDSARALCAGDRPGSIVPVFGSESIREAGTLAALRQAWPQAVLSLDRRGGQLLDPAGCWQSPALWPQRVIVMTLDRVGSGEGPDLDRLREAARLAPGREWIGAGGVRRGADLAAAGAAGATAWLVASALHDGLLGQPPGVGPADPPRGTGPAQGVPS